MAGAGKNSSFVPRDTLIALGRSASRAKATILYAQTRDIRSIQLLLGHTKIENTVRYLGVDPRTRKSNCECRRAERADRFVPYY